MNTFVPCRNMLPPAQLALWPMLTPCAALGFTLYGGTAVALRLGHRASIDFDFFSHLPLNNICEQALYDSLPFLNTARLLQSAPDTRTWLTDADVKLSFFGNIGFGRVGKPQMTDDDVLRVASPEDLLATKLAVILKRIEAKDYADIAALLRHGLCLAYGLAYATALYGASFSATESAKALTWFKGGDMDMLAQTDKDALCSAVKTLVLQTLPQVSLCATILS